MLGNNRLKTLRINAVKEATPRHEKVRAHTRVQYFDRDDVIHVLLCRMPELTDAGPMVFDCTTEVWSRRSVEPAC